LPERQPTITQDDDGGVLLRTAMPMNELLPKLAPLAPSACPVLSTRQPSPSNPSLPRRATSG